MSICETADRFLTLVINRFKTEQPGRELTREEKDNIWFSIHGKLSRGEPETEVEEFCKSVKLGRRPNDCK